MHKSILLGLLLVFVLNSCSNYRYISNKNKLPEIVIEQYETQNVSYKLQPFDYLYVSINSTNEQINKLYEQISSQYSQGNAGNEASFFLTGYLISDSGYVSIPTVGNLYVRGLTIDQTRKLIQEKINEILNDAIVNVRLTSFNVTFLGEVNNSGKIPFYKEKVNILEGIGMAGGFNNYGDKKKVKIIRPTDSTMLVFTLNLTNANIIEQKEFYLFPNDIVYVPPKRSKEFIDFMRDYSSVINFFTGTITTTILILQLYNNNGQ